MTQATARPAKPKARLVVNLFRWPALAVDGVAPALLAMEIDLALPPPVIAKDGRSEEDAEFVQHIEWNINAEPVRSASHLFATHKCRLAYICIAIGSADEDTIVTALSWSKAARALGANTTLAEVRFLGFP